MPNRILREGILTSPKVALLDVHEEVFYRRLMSVVDDFGRYHGSPMLLRAACFPLKLDKVTDKDIGKWLAACQAAGLVTYYDVDGMPYVEILNFGTARAKKSKFPDPPESASNCTQTQTDASNCTQMRPYSYSYSDSSSDAYSAGKPAPSPPEKPQNLKPAAREILDFLNEKAGRNYQPVDANLDFIVARLKEGATAAQCRQVIAKKAREWGGDEKMAEFLRPATLFNKTKFAQYQGELT